LDNDVTRKSAFQPTLSVLEGAKPPQDDPPYIGSSRVLAQLADPTDIRLAYEDEQQRVFLSNAKPDGVCMIILTNDPTGYWRRTTMCSEDKEIFRNNALLTAYRPAENSPAIVIGAVSDDVVRVSAGAELSTPVERNVFVIEASGDAVDLVAHNGARVTVPIPLPHVIPQAEQ
jgi:hypothetical protein